ncbi:MAG: hypothetical protein ACTHPD_12320 [Rhizomicrobium sp.]
MTKFNSDGEVFGSKVLTLAIIAVSAFILAGTVYSPSVQDQKASVQTQQIVDTVHTTANRVSG